MPYYASFFHLFLLHQYFIRTGHSFSFSSSTDSSITRAMAIIETAESQSYNLRPYDPTRGSDITDLKEICANVYGGGDYLPQMAASYVADDACSFLALTSKHNDDIIDAQTTHAKDGDDDTILAVANYKRLPAQSSAWIEAIRTHPDHRNKGLASTLLQSLVNLSKEEDNDTNILTCTVQSNFGMQRALEKVGFVKSGIIPTLQFAKLKELPGWTPDCDKKAQPLLDALDLNHLVSHTARSISYTEDTISSNNELLERLAQCKRKGCSGYMPGLYEYIVPGPNRADLKQSMESGLVISLEIAATQKEVSRCEDDGSSSDCAGQALLVLTKDERISSLKSKWVCSIVAHNQIGFEVALLHAHSHNIAKRTHSFDHGKDNKEMTNWEEDVPVSAPPFCLVFDDAIPIEPGTLAHALPRVTDECIVFSYQHD